MKDVEKLGCCHEKEIGSFKYEPREKFINLKKYLKHISNSLAHSNAVKSDIQKRQEADKLVSHNREAGMNLQRLCMKIYVLGRPYTDYELDVFLHKKAGANVQLNHSEKFPATFRPSCRFQWFRQGTWLQ